MIKFMLDGQIYEISDDAFELTPIEPMELDSETIDIFNGIGCSSFIFNLKDCYITNAIAVVLGIESNNYRKMHGMPKRKRNKR